MSNTKRTTITMKDDLRGKAFGKCTLEGRKLSAVINALLNLWVGGKIKL